MRRNRSIWLALAALVASCVAPIAPVSENSAVIVLAEQARTELDAGRLPNAAAALERALRIEPKNPRLWRELALVHLRQRDYPQAEQLATRSNSWAGNDDALRAENWRLIAEARAARGDAAGAEAALERARHAER